MPVRISTGEIGGLRRGRPARGPAGLGPGPGSDRGGPWGRGDGGRRHFQEEGATCTVTKINLGVHFDALGFLWSHSQVNSFFTLSFKLSIERAELE